MTCHYCQASAKKFGKFGPKKIQRYRCLQCGKTFSDEQEKPLDDMRIPLEKAIQVINLLVEGVGINAAARITNVNKETVLKLLVLAGERCAKLMDARLRDLTIDEIQCDEIFGFVEKKARNVRPTDNPLLVGDQYTYVALDPKTKLVITFRVGKRDVPNTVDFIRDLSERVISDVQISTDAFGAYRGAIRHAFGPWISYGTQTKIYSRKADARYSPPEVIGCIRQAISGTPTETKISTSLVERQNLNIRTFMRRMTRLCLGFSKKLENLKAAAALYFAWSNFCRVHATIKTTPAIASGLTDHQWTIEELLKAA